MAMLGPDGRRLCAADPATLRDYLKASHFSLALDPRLHQDARRSKAHADFPAYPVTAAAPPDRPPSPSQLFHYNRRWKDDGYLPEMRRAFALTSAPPGDTPEQRRERARTLQASHLPLHAGAHAGIGLSLAHAAYGWHGMPPLAAREQIRGARLIFDRDSVPAGDKDKLGIPHTTHKAHFQPYSEDPPPRAPSYHLGGPNPLRWNYKGPIETSNSRQFRALPGPPAPMYKRASSSVQLGDRNINYTHMHSDLKQMHTPQELSPDRYDKAQASAQLFQANINPGDGHFYHRTTMNDHFYPREPEPFTSSHDETPDSHILKGNWQPGPGNLDTSMQYFFGQTPPATQPPSRHLPLEKQKDHVALGDTKLLREFFHTTTRSTYGHLEPQPTQIAPSLHLLPSTLPLGTGELQFSTENQSSFKPHGVAPAAMMQDLLWRCKYSHLEPPLGDQRFLSTTYKDEFPFKYNGPLVLKPNVTNESHLPLGSPKWWGCWGRKVDPRAPQISMNPCPSLQ
ncbi:stabilizer of axonemal microtubules 5 isoform X1 [Dipodomys merriami]|uniref:stabilizer of axonemal microtubules 5 isoform X1 n=1 Tax=Dipodomys merriami TaxID=94247 RepID=UPI003855B944